MDESLLRFWEFIKVPPVKWEGQTFSEGGDGFWVVAIFGVQVIWYNDIEDGFNISNYTRFGQIDNYQVNQSELYQVTEGLLERFQP